LKPVSVVLFRLLARLPLPVVHRIGGLLGWLLWRIPNRSRRVTDINLRLCFPDASHRELRRLARRSLIETGKTALEIGPLMAWDRATTLALVRGTSGEELVKKAIALGKGVIMATPHLGCWEMAGLYCSVHYPITSLYRPQSRSPELDAYVRRGRERLGARLVPTGAKGVRALYGALAKGEMAGILPDQNPGAGKGVFVPLFGVLANTMVLPSRLAQRSGATVIFTYAERLPGGRGFHMHFLPAPSEIHDKDMATSAAALNRGLEECIRRLPEQYWWSYKRYRTRPEGEPPIYYTGLDRRV
jgi:KDO2-lipid IV(A) lauroyltransferase